MEVDPADHLDLTDEDLREVVRYAAQGAEEVLEIFERACRDDPRPREALSAAWEFANGARRTDLQRRTAFGAHRAAKAAPTPAARHAASAAADAAAAAYLHPIARAHQVAHILRADAHAAYARELLAGDTAIGDQAVRTAARRATPLLVDVLCRYPRAPGGRSRVAVLMKALDDELRAA